ncbi:MAG: S-layer homology domain-containing protein [Clostridia bacterium]|nr:S-layer homology domain-containing protein [Clostridia bacterium]
MKKTISMTALLCACIMLLQSFVCISFAQDEAEAVPLSSEEYALFDALDMINEDMKLYRGEPVSRGDFAYVLACMCGYRGDAVSSGRFSDIIDEAYYSGAVNFLADRGIVSGYMSEFRPADGIIYDEAAVMAVKALGYYEYAKIKYGDYPGNSRIMADVLDIFDYLPEFNYSDVITGEDAFIILENISDVPVLNDVSYKNDDIIYEKDDSKTLLSVNCHIYRDSGKLTDNGITSLDNVSALGDNRVSIDGKNFEISENLYFVRDLVGEKTDYWYREDADELIYARRDTENTYRLELVYDELAVNDSSFSASSIVYYDARDRKKTAEVSLTADVFYNGVAYPYYTANDFKLTSGSMVLIDENTDKVYDTVKITQYTDSLVSGTSASQMQIITAEKLINLEEYTSYSIEDINGNPVDFAKLNEKTPISVAESRDGKAYIKIIDCSALTVSGILESIADGDELCWNVGGKDYGVSLNLAEEMELAMKKSPSAGESYTFYFNADGKISDFAQGMSSGDWYDGYVLAISDRTVSMKEKLIARILMPDQTTIDVFFAEKFKLNDVSMESKNAADSPELFRFDSGEKLTRRQPIRFKLNEWEEINAFDTPKDITSEDYVIDTGVFSLDRHFAGAQYKAENINAINGIHLVTPDTIIIQDPYLDADSENVDGSEVVFLTINDISATEGLENCYLYDLDETMSIGTVVFQEFPGNSGTSFDEAMYIVDRVYRTLDDNGIDVSRIDCGGYGAMRTFDAYDQSVSFSGLERGNVISLKFRNGKVLEWELLCSVNEPSEAKYVYAPQGIVNTLKSVIYAPVISVNSKGFVVKGPDTAPGNEQIWPLIGNSFNNNNTRVIVYNVKEKSIKAGSVSSIYANVVPDEKGNVIIDDSTTRVLLRRRWGYAAEVIFIIY